MVRFAAVSAVLCWVMLASAWGGDVVATCDQSVVVKDLTDLYEKLSRVTGQGDRCSTLDKQTLAEAGELQRKLKEHILSKMGISLSSLVALSRSLNDEYGHIVLKLISEFEKPMESMANRSADKGATNEKPEEAAYGEWKAYKHAHLKEQSGLEALLDKLLQQYWTFRASDEKNDKYLADVSYYLHQIKGDPFYKHVDEKLKARVDLVVHDLPSSMQQLYFKPFFCLLNKKYHENLYTAEMRWNADRRQVYTWADHTWVDRHGYFTPILEEGGRNETLALSLKLLSVKFETLLYMDREMAGRENVIAAWEGKNLIEECKWEMEMADNHVVLQQNGHLMCVKDELSLESRRAVYGFKDDKHTRDSEQCQWIVDECTNLIPK